MQSLVNYIR